MPFPVTYRELWTPSHIKGTQLAPSMAGGHPVTLTGATKASTCDGVFIPSPGSEINLGALHNSAPKFWVSFRFNLAQDRGTVDFQHFITKWNGIADYISVRFMDTLSTLVFSGMVVGVSFSTNVNISYLANTWYHVLASISNVNGGRLRVNNGVASTDATVVTMPTAGNLMIGGRNIGDTYAARATISDVIMGTDDLTGAEETDLYNGIPPADAVHAYPLDEGRGVTATDRGSGANNGTLGATAIWKFGQVKQPALSVEGINDYGASSSGVSIKNPLTIVVVHKVKNTQASASATHSLLLARVDAGNYLKLLHATGANGCQFIASGGGAAQTLSYLTQPTIDDYRIYIATLTAAGVITLYVNGVSVATAAGVGAIDGSAANAYLGATNTPDQYSVDKPLLSALIEGALTATQVLTYSRWLKDVMNLPITV